MSVRFDSSVDGIDWEAAKADLAADHFDNGRSPTAMDENAALQLGQRRSRTPVHCGQASGMSPSNSSNQRRAAPHVRQNATQSPRTLRRSSRSQSDAFPMPPL